MPHSILSELRNSSFWHDCRGQLIVIVSCIFILGYLIIRPPSRIKDPIGLGESLIAGFCGITNMFYYRLFIVGWLVVILVSAMILSSISIVSRATIPIIPESSISEPVFKEPSTKLRFYGQEKRPKWNDAKLPYQIH